MDDTGQALFDHGPEEVEGIGDEFDEGEFQHADIRPDREFFRFGIQDSPHGPAVDVILIGEQAVLDGLAVFLDHAIFFQ